jgi:prepilin signal peptidase PulO-like enzyme (type II secretory pathway)
MTTLATETAVPVEIHRPRRLVLDRSVAACFAIAALLHVGLGARGLLVACVVAILVELAAVDLERRILPNRIVLPALLVVLGAQLVLDPSFYVKALVSAAAAGFFLLVPALIRRGALGMGDVKLAALVGAALGPLAATALGLGLTAAGGYALLLVAMRSRAALKQEIPLGPFIAGGAIAAVLLAAPGALG